MKKVGLDIHGVIDTYPDLFSYISERLIRCKWEVHIITGQEKEKALPQVLEAKVSYTHFYSIVDYHREQGTHMWQDEKGTWWMGPDYWLSSKGDYCKREEIDVHFDDSVEYAQFMPETCNFVLVSKSNFDKFMSLFRNTCMAR